MRPAAGFLTDDGMFFDFVEDAEMYDAIHKLHFAATTCGIDPDKLIAAVEAVAPEIVRYIHAKQNKDRAETSRAKIHWTNDPDCQCEVCIAQRSDEASTSAVDHTNHGYAEKVNASVFDEPSRFDEPMPDVGSGLSAEALPDYSEVYGIRSRRSDAPSVRSDPDMAVSTQAEIAKTW